MELSGTPKSRVKPVRTGLPSGLPFLTLRSKIGCSPMTTVAVGVNVLTTVIVACEPVGVGWKLPALSVAML